MTSQIQASKSYHSVQLGKTEMGGTNAKYEVADSVEKILSVTDDLTPDQNGKFWGEDGKEIPW